ncbi:MAG TPA: DUF2252 family protein [Candidatus Acidoferrales bacterium]|nr:DUF2252 family protein [Candidatus Acidoferrales bacterium]
MDIKEATASYEMWLRGCTHVVESGLKLKHAQMRQDPFFFFRGAYYRWTQLWPEFCKDVLHAPKILCSGDLHVGSFGTWRDSEGRLCWGVDDFDDAYPLPYTNDLIRLAASVKMVTDARTLTIKFRDGCDAILEGYTEAMRDGGCPFVLAEQEQNMKRLGIEAIKPAKDFWRKLVELPSVNPRGVPSEAKSVLKRNLPPKVDYKIVRRQAGMGSLGQARFVAVAHYEGGYIAREMKATVPSASVWNAGQKGRGERYYDRLIGWAIRSHDPYQKVEKGWLIRRLSPDSNPIEIGNFPRERDEYTLLNAMGKETANIHLGSKGQVSRVLADLRKRNRRWLRRAGKEMAKVMEKEWNDYRS